MKKLISILVLYFLISGSAFASKIGKGQIQLSDEVTESFIKFLRNEYGAFFVVNPDGTHAVYGVCGAKQCKGGMLQVLKWCKEDTGQTCHVFAQRKNKEKIIRWNNVNYKFPSENWNYNEWQKEPTSNSLGIKKNITNEEVKEILSELGFLNSNTENIKVASNSKKKRDKKDIIYLACLNVMEKDKSKPKEFNKGDEFGFTYFKLDPSDSKITAHEQILDAKPNLIGSAYVDFEGKKSVNFVIEDDGSRDEFTIKSKGYFYKDDGYENYTFTAKLKLSDGNTKYDWSYKADLCIPPKDKKKEEKIYKKWIKSGF